MTENAYGVGAWLRMMMGSGQTPGAGGPPPLAIRQAVLAAYACFSGVRTTRPSSSSLTLIWQDSREFARTS
jgi:hypothetical protein